MGRNGDDSAHPGASRTWVNSQCRPCWVDADHLRVGDVLLSLDGGQQQVEAISLDETTIDVYNFHVDRLETYAVGVAGWLVHNTYAGNLNKNSAVSQFGVYTISVFGSPFTIGKADLLRVTKSTGLATRIHQQIRKLEKIFGIGNVTVSVENVGRVTTEVAKGLEKAAILKNFRESGMLLLGNWKSFRL